MPTTACPACGQPLSASADRCPGCGQVSPAAADATVTQDGPARPDAPTLTAHGWSASTTPVSLGTSAIPGYQILGELGRGGMGVVYRAHEASLNRPVALKVLLSGGHGGPTAVARFRTEAEAAAAVQHRHIVRVFAVGEHAGLPFIAMELVPGESLAARLASGPLDPSEAARVVEAVARGVAAAHDRGIVHRDLKPANVLFTADGEPKVADFGLAKVGESGLTVSGAVMGTPAYMAPEQARGDTKVVGPTTDVWALGAILHECLTGRPPFRGASAPDTLRRVCEADPEPLRGVPKDLATITRKCLEKDPARRYSSAGAVADDLRRFLDGEPIAARPYGPTVRLARWVGRHKGPTYAAVGAVLAAVISLVLLSLKSKPDAPPEPGPGPIAELPPDLALVPADAFAFATVRPKDVWDQPAVRKLINDLLAIGEAAGEVGPAEQAIEDATGLRPTDVERITFVIRKEVAQAARSTEFLVVARTVAPVELKRVRDRLEELFGNFEPRERHGRRYYAAKPGELAFGLFKAGDRDVLFGHVAEIEAAIDRMDAPSVDGPLSPALKAAAGEHALVVGSRSPAKLIGLVAGGDGPQMPPELARGSEQLKAVETAIVALDLRPATSDNSLSRADVTIRFRFPTEVRAAESLPALRGALRWLGRTDPEPATTGLAALLPAVQTAVREAEVRQEGTEVVVSGGPRWTPDDLASVNKKPVRNTEWKLKQIGLALHNYEITHGRFPPAVIRGPADRPLYSWRVELLPYLEHDSLYRRLNRKEAWDHPDNKELLEQIPEIYALPADEPSTMIVGTRFQALVGKGGIFDPAAEIRLSEVTDGSRDTVLIVEAGELVHWAAPKDVEYKVGGPLPKLGLRNADTFLVLMGDASIKRLVRSKVLPADLTAIFTRNGNETVDWERLEWRKKGK